MSQPGPRPFRPFRPFRPRRPRRPRRLRRLALALLALLVGATTWAQVTGSWSLGPYNLLQGPPSPPLRVRMSRASLGSYAFVGRVGGVAFGAVATPDESIAGQAIRLSYDPKRPDGERLTVTVGDTSAAERLPQRLPDWQLTPIARYANSEFNACVSLFGESTTDESYEITYHEALQDTLLGVRILQADILFFDLSETWRLPSRGGRVVLGRGESAPAKLDLPNLLILQRALGRGSFQSWVLTDVDVPVVLSRSGDRVEISGSPYYYFWKSDFATYEREYNRLRARAEALRAEGRVREFNAVAAQINALEPTVHPVPAITEPLRKLQDALRTHNAPVYDAATRTMRYAALFRYVKQTSPGHWSSFLDSLAGVDVDPDVKTPTRWAKP